IVLRVADTYDYLYKPCPDQPLETASEEDKTAWKAEYKKHNNAACLMLGKMSPALQKQFESYPPQLMLAELKKMFENRDLRFGGYSTQLQAGPGKIRECPCAGNERLHGPTTCSWEIL
nr:hypothetical protein [Tanacetum cinerariifolium]